MHTIRAAGNQSEVTFPGLSYPVSLQDFPKHSDSECEERQSLHSSRGAHLCNRDCPGQCAASIRHQLNMARLYDIDGAGRLCVCFRPIMPPTH